MREHTAAQQPTVSPDDNRISVPFNDEEIEVVRHAADIAGQVPIQEFIRRAATHEARKRISENSQLRVAEDPTEYRTDAGNS